MRMRHLIPPVVPNSATMGIYSVTIDSNYSVGDFIWDIQELAGNDESQSVILGWIQEMAGRLGYSMRHDTFTADAVSGAAATFGATAESEFAGAAATEVAEAASSEEAAAAGPESASSAEPAAAAGGNLGVQHKKLTQRARERRQVPVSFDREGRLSLHIDPAILPATEIRTSSARGGGGSGRGRGSSRGGGRGGRGGGRGGRGGRGSTNPRAEIHSFDDMDRDKFVARVQLVRTAEAKNVRQCVFHTECNSIVIDALCWTLLALVPRPFASQAPPPSIPNQLEEGDYHIFHMDDGTLATLYHWMHPNRTGIWCMATTNGYDVSHLADLGGKPWAQSLYESMQRTMLPADTSAAGGASADEASASAGPISIADKLGATLQMGLLGEGDCRISFKHLSPTACYTVTFRNFNIHPLVADPEGVWGTQWIDKSVAPGPMAYQPKFDFAGGPAEGCFLPQREITPAELKEFLASRIGGPAVRITVEAMRQACESAIPRAQAVVQNSEYGTYQPNPDVRFEYGFIIRSRDIRKTGAASDFIVSSPLIDFIRRAVYGRVRRADQELVTPENRHTYNAIRAVIDPAVQETFLSLFPEHRNTQLKCQEIQKGVTQYVVDQIRRRQVNQRDPQTKPPLAPLGDSIISQLEREYTGITAGAHRPDAIRSIVRGYMSEPNSAPMYLRFITD